MVWIRHCVFKGWILFLTEITFSNIDILSYLLLREIYLPKGNLGKLGVPAEFSVHYVIFFYCDTGFLYYLFWKLRDGIDLNFPSPFYSSLLCISLAMLYNLKST